MADGRRLVLGQTIRQIWLMVKRTFWPICRPFTLKKQNFTGVILLWGDFATPPGSARRRPILSGFRSASASFKVTNKALFRRIRQSQIRLFFAIVVLRLPNNLLQKFARRGWLWYSPDGNSLEPALWGCWAHEKVQTVQRANSR